MEMSPSSVIQSLFQSSNKKAQERPCMDLVKNDIEAQNFMNDISYNPYDILEQIKELDSTGKKPIECYAKERCQKETKRMYGSLMKTPPPNTSPIKINP